ncbi:hypothetical protein ACIGFK_14295 [Streptomyces sp. NPDC085524]|uniref:hypothetical protein n=1 Tax=Streptomyces sp. NPDC085524 TaxID=3365728 RepID=UPI0037D7548E
MPNRYVRLAGFDQRLDLTKPDLGVAGGAALLEQLLNDRRLPVQRRGLTCAEVCEKRGFIEPMSVYRRLGKVIAAHMQSDAEDRHHGGGESDEHKAYKDRAVRAAEEGGHAAVQEQSSKDHAVRSDVLIHGVDGVLLGFESQLSPRNPREIQARDVAARRAGVLDAWQTDSQDMARDTTVPWLRTDRVPLELIMKRGAPIPLRGGIRRIELAKCDERFPGPCPKKRTGKCGGWHPTTRPAERPFDEFIRDAASGLYVRAIVKVKRTAFEFWTPTADHTAYLDATSGEPPAVMPRQRQVRRPMEDGDPTCRVRPPAASDHETAPLPYIPAPRSPESVPSTRPAVKGAPPIAYRGKCGAGVQPCGAPARLYPAGWLCDDHRP